MDRWLARMARVLGTAIGAFAGVAAVQFMRLRRMEFLPGHPGFYVNHVVIPSQGDAGAGGTPAADGRRSATRRRPASGSSEPRTRSPT